MVIALEKERSLRYGENPHQEAAAYSEPATPGWWTSADQLQGKQMSFNNYLDAEAAWRLAHEFDEPAVAIVKHANPCGLAVATSQPEAFTAAWECDPLSAFGGVIACNRPLEGETARRIGASGFVEVVVAPAVDDAAREELSGKRNLRVVAAQPPAASDPDLRRIDGGFVLQPRDAGLATETERRVVSARPPTADEMADLEFAWRVVAHTKSNAIVVAKGGAAFGIGAGDQSRVGAAERAVVKAGDRSQGAVAASDAFFPFRDGLDVLANAGVTAIIEPGGSVRDDELIAAADEKDIALVFTGRRHFRH
jgi:phosphoribosylaminoimidazolecarboxamide formyltransferase/IMP cyclohydrolase